ncbi:MAG: 4Fe-4S binding protein [Caldiserica bacterium]|nr:4Fe-4S binding protein [Caldisericota bacterium]MDH7562057.1 4Fe-4S binding protein [Caldisericota bacterium]
MTRPGAIWREITKNLGRKPATVLYPKERLPIPSNFRGRPVFDPEKCVGCKICERDCPSGVITIEKVAEKTFACTFSLDKCIFCGQCADSCPRKAITMSQIFELAAFKKDSLVDRKAGTPPEPKAQEEEKKDEGQAV